MSFPLPFFRSFSSCLLNYLSNALRSLKETPAGIVLISGLEHNTDEISEGDEGKYPGIMLLWGHQHLLGRIFTEHVMLTLAWGEALLGILIPIKASTSED